MYTPFRVVAFSHAKVFGGRVQLRIRLFHITVFVKYETTSAIAAEVLFLTCQ